MLKNWRMEGIQGLGRNVGLEVLYSKVLYLTRAVGARKLVSESLEYWGRGGGIFHFPSTQFLPPSPPQGVVQSRQCDG